VSMAYDTLLQEARDGVAVITVNRPDVRNAVNGRVAEEMRDILHNLRDDRSVGVVVFTGAGEKHLWPGPTLESSGKGRSSTGSPQSCSVLRRYRGPGETDDRCSQRIRVRRWLRARHGLRHPRSSENARFGLSEISLSGPPMASIARCTTPRRRSRCPPRLPTSLAAMGFCSNIMWCDI
jgi:enoyl-CoA hydratase